MKRIRPFPDRMAYGMVIAGLGVFIVLSHPFLKIPYDIWQHLIMIASIHDESQCFVFWPDDIRTGFSWHAAWATLFRFLRVNDIFVWAKVIHTVQFLFAALVMLYGAGIIFRYLFPGLKQREGKWLALASVAFWFLGNGTYSVEYQQAWIMWYSVNYQSVSIPLFWYMVALTVRLLCRKDATTGALALDILQIAAAALIIARVHSMELLYYLGHLGVLILFFPDRLWQILRKYLILFPTLLAGLAVVIFFGVEKRSSLTEAIITSGFDPVSVFNRIMETGRSYRAMNLSRFPAAFSEAALLALVAGLFSVGCLWYDPGIRKKLNIRLFLSQIAATLFFFLIPLTTVTAGFAGLVTYPSIVWRFFFAAPWFLLFPAILFLVVRRLSPEAGPGWALGGSVTSILILVLISKTFLTGVFYENTRSILNALNPNKVGPYYTQKEVVRLEALISQKKSQDPTKPAMFYLRGDLAYLVRGCLRRYVYVSRLSSLPRESFFERGLDRRYHLIDVDVGPDFPREERIFRSFAFK